MSQSWEQTCIVIMSFASVTASRNSHHMIDDELEGGTCCKFDGRDGKEPSAILA